MSLLSNIASKDKEKTDVNSGSVLGSVQPKTSLFDNIKPATIVKEEPVAKGSIFDNINQSPKAPKEESMTKENTSLFDRLATKVAEKIVETAVDKASSGINSLFDSVATSTKAMKKTETGVFGNLFSGSSCEREKVESMITVDMGEFKNDILKSIVKNEMTKYIKDMMKNNSTLHNELKTYTINITRLEINEAIKNTHEFIKGKFKFFGSIDDHARRLKYIENQEDFMKKSLGLIETGFNQIKVYAAAYTEYLKKLKDEKGENDEIFDMLDSLSKISMLNSTMPEQIDILKKELYNGMKDVNHLLYMVIPSWESSQALRR